jgi:beta-phosphoglucomutase-like phosphatase (HAD superfamily)
MYEAVKEVLSEHKVKLTIPMFAKYFAKKSPAVAVKSIAQDFEVDSLAANGVIDKIRDTYVNLINTKGSCSKGLVKLIGELRERGIKLGALTCLDQDSVDGILAKLKLTSDDICIMPSQHCGRAVPTAQDWLQLAKETGESTTLCTVASTSAFSTKAALCAGMRCFAIPDKMTAFQDFSGADYVIDSLDDEAEDFVLKLIEAF